MTYIKFLAIIQWETNRFKGLDLIDRVTGRRFGGSSHCIGGSDEDHPPEKEMQKGKMVV